MKRKQLKLVAAGMGAGAAVAIGVVGLSFAESPSSAGTLSQDTGMTVGETSTESVAATELETTRVTPPVTAEPPDGFGISAG